MADEASWQYEVSSVQRGGVTGEVIRRRHGEVYDFDPDNTPDSNEQPTENERAKADGYADKWQKRFSHLPGVNKTNGD